MRFIVLFVTAVFVLFLIKRRWTKKKNFYDTLMYSCMIGTSSLGYLWLSLEFFDNSRTFLKMFKNNKSIVWPSDSFWRIFGNIRKAFGNLQKIVKKVFISIKQNNTLPLVDMD